MNWFKPSSSEVTVRLVHAVNLGKKSVNIFIREIGG